MTRTTERSDALLAAAETLMPGGVNSPVRAFRSVGGNPPFIASAEGAYITDADGNQFEFVQYLSEVAEERNQYSLTNE